MVGLLRVMALLWRGLPEPITLLRRTHSVVGWTPTLAPTTGAVSVPTDYSKGRHRNSRPVADEDPAAIEEA